MSWNSRDYSQPGAGESGREAPAPPILDDAEPLPTYAVGLEAYADDGTSVSVPTWQRRAMHQQGLWTQPELDTWSRLMRRGIDPL